MKMNVHAGHNPDGKTACGAIGFIQESTEARKVKDEVISRLRQMGHTVYDCTCENGTSQADVLTQIVKKCNAHAVDLDVSIHFNAGAKDPVGNGVTTGTEVYVYNTGSRAKGYAEQICTAVSGLGFQNRGVKYNTNLYFLRKTKSPAMLIECCFVDDRDDVQLYNCQKMAEAIVYGITGQKAATAVAAEGDTEAEAENAETIMGDSRKISRVQVGAYSVRENAEAIQKKLKDAGFDAMIVSS